MKVVDALFFIFKLGLTLTCFIVAWSFLSLKDVVTLKQISMWLGVLFFIQAFDWFLELSIEVLDKLARYMQSKKEV